MRESDLFKEVGDGQCSWTESGKVTHVVPDTHPLAPLFLSVIPCSVALSLWQEETTLERRVHECDRDRALSL